jgi:predicted RNA-binding Zn-ribbon protein involved in translation (DUF1610 family)
MNLTQESIQQFAEESERAPAGHSCPDCGDEVYRVKRRFVDHLVCMVVVRRYHCMSPDCDWEGNLRI